LVMEMKDDEGCGFDRWLSNGGAAAENDIIGSVSDVIEKHIFTAMYLRVFGIGLSAIVLVN
ncbi:hypothetical protein Tco_0342827, partial [Tanacetum coccineum]